MQHYYGRSGRTIRLEDAGLYNTYWGADAVRQQMHGFYSKTQWSLAGDVRSRPCTTSQYTFSLKDKTSTDVTNVIFVLGNSSFFREVSCTVKLGRCRGCCAQSNIPQRSYTATCDFHFYIRDWFRDPWDLGFEPGGVPYRINSDLREQRSLKGDSCSPPAEFLTGRPLY